MADQERISKLEQRVDRLEDIIKNLSHTTENLHVGVMKDECYIHTTLRNYIKEYCDDFKHDNDYPDKPKTCDKCKYYLHRSNEYPCSRCRRNNVLVDEIREQQNDRWKDSTLNG